MEENKKQMETSSIVGFVLSFVMPLIGLILSIIGLNKSKKNGGADSLAIAGLIISIFGLFIRAAMVLLAIFTFGFIRTEGAGLIDNTVDQMCSKVQKCENLFGNYYSCTYKNNNVNYSMICREDRIPESATIINDNEIDLESIESLAGSYYMDKYDGILTKTPKATIEGDKVIIEVEGIKITIDKETFVGFDSHGFYVDLTEYIRDDL